jgi:hypothetical protein
MPTDQGVLDGIGSDSCHVGPNSGGSSGGSSVPSTEDAPTWVIWIWECAGTDMSACQAYGVSQGWILQGDF